MVFCRRQTLVSVPVFPTNTNISKMQAQSGKDYEGEADFFPQNITDDSKALAFCKLLYFPVADLCGSQPSWEFSLSVGAPRKHREDKISHIDSRIGEAPDGETFWCPCHTRCAAQQHACIFCAVSTALFPSTTLALQDYKKEIKLEPIKPVYSLLQIFLPRSFVCRKCCKLQHCCWLLCNHSADYELLPFGSCCLHGYDFCWWEGNRGEKNGEKKLQTTETSGQLMSFSKVEQGAR